MTKEKLIKRTTGIIQMLPERKAEEIADFADFILKRFEEDTLSEGMQQLVSEPGAFSFLKEEEELYSESDLKELFDE